MKRSHALPLLLLALLFGGWPALQEYVSERTAVEPTGQEIIPPVVMYTTQSCPYCHRARAYFDRHVFQDAHPVHGVTHVLQHERQHRL